MSFLSKAIGLAVVLALAGCASQKIPQNAEAPEAGEAYQARYRAPDTEGASGFIESMQCRDAGTMGADGVYDGKAGAAMGLLGTRGPEILSVGDLVQVFVEQDDVFTGDYVIGVDGRLRLPFAR